MNNKVKCCLCGTSKEDTLNLGEIKTCKGYTAHYYCLLLASTIKQSGKDEEGILGFLPSDINEELKRSKTRICAYCKKRGASVICNAKHCKIVFHLPCGIKNNSGHQFYGRYLSNCINHRPKQKYAKPKEQQSCPICYDFVNFNIWTDVLWAPCCKKNSYFHKSCLQQMALSAGYFFKCPICNNTDVFQRTMKHFGVFIPDRDASWELVPNAFQELLYRHDECNVKICLCTRGRKYSNYGPWALVLCSTCGSQGTHISCSKLKKDQLWHCSDCVGSPNNNQSTESEQPSNNITISSLKISDTQPSTSRIHNSDGTKNMPTSSQTINKRKRKRSSSEKKNEGKPSTSGTTSKSITETAIEIDSDSDVVVIEEDEPTIKCLVAQDGKVLPVRNISTNDTNFSIQGDLNISEISKTDGLKNLVISDVRSLKEPTVKKVQLDKQCDNIPNENQQVINNVEMSNYVLFSTGNNDSRNSKNTVSVIDTQGNVYILKEILGFPIFSNNQITEDQNNQNVCNNNQQENEIVIID